MTVQGTGTNLIFLKGANLVMNQEERKKCLFDDDDNNTTTGQGATQQNEGGNAVFDELLKNYDKAEYIPPPERVGLFVRGYINILAGQAGIGKSWQVIRWARDLSRGGECFGGVVHNEKPRKVLIIAGELPKREMERRCRLLEEGDGIERNYDNFFIVDIKEAEAAKRTLMLDSNEGQQNIEALIAYSKPDIIFFDSFISLFSGDEKDSKDVNGALCFLERIAEQYKVAPVVIHHVRKRLSREQSLPLGIDDVIGSSVFSRRSGFMFAAEKTEDGQVRVKEVKSWLEPTKPFKFKVKSGFYGQGVVMDITTNVEDIQPQTTAKQQKTPPDWKILVMTYLKGKGEEGATIQEINEALGRNKKEYDTTANQVSRMTRKRELQQVKRGIYKLPDEIATKEDNSQLEFDDEDLE